MLRIAVLPALFAGLVAVGVTVVIERFGGRLGGVIGTLPSTIVPAALGIAEAADPRGFVRAMNTAPAGILLNALFLYLWRVAPSRLQISSLRLRLSAMIALSLSIWALGAAAMIFAIDRYLKMPGSSAERLGLGFTLLLALVGLAACAARVPAPRGHNPVGIGTLISRGLLAAAAVGTSGWLASTRIALAAGMAAVFPAIFLTTMVSLWLSQGEAVPAGAVGPMMLGATSVAVFCLVASWALPTLGRPVGTTVAWVLAALMVTLPVSLWFYRHREQDSADR